MAVRIAAVGFAVLLSNGMCRELMRKEHLAGVELHSNKDTDMCNDDYPLGNADTNNCSLANAAYENILQEAMCIQAAKDANATVVHDKFRLVEDQSDWYDKRPKGCFKAECGEDPKGVCYFYNPVGDVPKHPKGEPVCSRPRYLNGTANATTGVKCPADYQSIMHEDACQEAGVCLGYCSGTEFREAVQNASKFEEFPLGCFIHAKLGCVFFNAPQTNRTDPPKQPQGTPICNVSKTTFYAWTGAHATKTNETAAAGETTTTKPPTATDPKVESADAAKAEDKAETPAEKTADEKEATADATEAPTPAPTPAP